MTAAPWERLPDETTRAFHAFTVYRELGPNRSFGKVREKTGKTPGYIRQIQRWASENRWVERSRAWDDEEDRVRREARLDALRAVESRHAEIAEKMLSVLVKPAEVFLERWERRDPSLLTDPEKGLFSTSGATLARLTADTARAMRAVIDVERVARGLVALPVEPEADKGLEDLLERVRAGWKVEDERDPEEDRPDDREARSKA